jgi:hypothetical protein
MQDCIQRGKKILASELGKKTKPNITKFGKGWKQKKKGKYRKCDLKKGAQINEFSVK